MTQPTSMTMLVTGAAGFIGSNLVRHLRTRWPQRPVVSFDALTYAGNLESLQALREDPLHHFVRGDVTDAAAVRAALVEYDVNAVFHLAAESHVDRSIVDPLRFVHTNVTGTATLLLEASRFWGDRDDVRFVHVSTDEVFGSLGPHDPPFCETTPYAPHSPYSASKAASDHLARAWHDTYGLPVLVTNCTNNYGPWQFPEKLVPVVITRAMAGEPIPVYGQGANIRDWLYVEDHCRALADVYERGTLGATYCIGGEAELSNLELVRSLLNAVDTALGRAAGTSLQLITFVDDRPGHDFRYAMDIRHVRETLGWAPSVSIEEGLARTVQWYLAHQRWCDRARSGEHREFEERWYAKRLAQGVRPPREDL